MTPLRRRGVAVAQRTEEQRARNTALKRASREADPEKARAYARAYYAATHEKSLARARKNGAAYVARQLATRPKEFRAERAAMARALYAANPEKFRAKSRRQQQEKSAKTPLEASVESYLKDRVVALDGLCMKFIDPGQRGAPDRLVVFDGRPTYYVELKRPKLGKLSAHQERYHQRLRDRGQQVWVLWSKEDVDAFLAAL